MRIIRKIENSDYPIWGTWLWRLVRAAFWTAVVQTFSAKIDWTNQDQAIKTIVVSLITGFLMALGMSIRDGVSGGNKNSVVEKLPI